MSLSKPSPPVSESSGDVDLKELVLALAWTCLNDTPTNEKNVLYDKFITSHTVFQDLASAVPIEFAPGLNEVLRDDALPTIEYLTTLPSDTVQGWGIYVLVYVKPGHPPCVYIGSATGSSGGIKR